MVERTRRFVVTEDRALDSEPRYRALTAVISMSIILLGVTGLCLVPEEPVALETLLGLAGNSHDVLVWTNVGTEHCPGIRCA